MKKDMPLEGLRWSRDSGSALYDTPQTAVLGRAGGGVISHIQYALKEECVLHPHALKGQKLLAQGIALGICGCKLVALKGQKLSISKLLPFLLYLHLEK